MVNCCYKRTKISLNESCINVKEKLKSLSKIRCQGSNITFNKQLRIRTLTFKCQPHKMVKHTQAIGRQTDHFVALTLKGLIQIILEQKTDLFV